MDERTLAIGVSPGVVPGVSMRTAGTGAAAVVAAAFVVVELVCCCKRGRLLVEVHSFIGFFMP